jgi:hypothetical protein
MRILPVIARLKAQSALLDNRVEPAQSVTALSDDEIASDLPIAFVYPAKENAFESNTVGITSQRVPKRFCVLIAAANSDGVDEPLEDVRDQIKAALIGWPPSSTHGEIEFVEGDVIEVSTRVIWWRDTYTTYTFNRG